MTAQVIEHTTSFLVQPPRITSQQSLFASHLSHLNKDYIKETAKPSIRVDAIGASASQAFVAGSYRSTELRWPPSPAPPTA